jgi:hypothetical protein
VVVVELVVVELVVVELVVVELVVVELVLLLPISLSHRGLPMFFVLQYRPLVATPHPVETSAFCVSVPNFPSTPPPQQPAQKATYVTGTVSRVVNYASSDGKACMAMVQLPNNRPNNLNLEPGMPIVVLAPNESFCTLFGLAKISNTPIHFVLPGPAPTAPPNTRNFRVTQVIL